jgi:hypothetical protein
MIPSGTQVAALLAQTLLRELNFDFVNLVIRRHVLNIPSDVF